MRKTSRRSLEIGFLGARTQAHNQRQAGTGKKGEEQEDCVQLSDQSAAAAGAARLWLRVKEREIGEFDSSIFRADSLSPLLSSLSLKLSLAVS